MRGWCCCVLEPRRTVRVQARYSLACSFRTKYTYRSNGFDVEEMYVHHDNQMIFFVSSPYSPQRSSPIRNDIRTRLLDFL